jgi:ribosomal protein S18 acetylase RimI-like enzyme
LRVSALGPQNQAAALAYLRLWPYRNALPLSNVTQLRPRCTVAVAEDAGRVVGVASHYRDLPIANMTFATDEGATLGPLLRALAEVAPVLRSGPFYALLPAERRDMLARYARLVDSEPEYQLAVEPETLRPCDTYPVRRLGPADAAALAELAAAAGLSVWHPSALALGPAFGCEVDGRLVAMAATHFATPDIVEIGHIATHPQERGRGYARACTTALVRAAFALAPRVFLMVLESNAPARAAYRALGFHPVETFHLARFILER